MICIRRCFPDHWTLEKINSWSDISLLKGLVRDADIIIEDAIQMRDTATQRIEQLSKSNWKYVIRVYYSPESEGDHGRIHSAYYGTVVLKVPIRDDKIIGDSVIVESQTHCDYGNAVSNYNRYVKKYSKRDFVLRNDVPDYARGDYCDL